MRFALLLLGAWCSACASGQPAPISYGGARSAPAPRDQDARTTPTQPTARPIAPEQAPAPDWAAGEGTPLSVYALRPDDAQPFHPAHLPRTHRVDAQESLYDIAARYQIPLRALIDQNNLAPPYALAPGREIELPPPRMHRVARGERFAEIARRYNIDTRSLALLNRMQPPYEVREGDGVVLPALARDSAPAAAPADVVRSAAGPGPSQFLWPVRGEIVRQFGRQGSGAQLDGVEIAVQSGAPIAAAADGEIVYAGSDLPGYGVLVLVRHSGDYVTAYGHASRALAEEGARVSAGQPIAEAGAGGKILFQVRRGTQAVDPLPLLGR